MGIADRARDALRPTNTIEAVSEPVQPPPKGLHGASPGVVQDHPTAPPSAEAVQGAKSDKRPAYASEPESISKTYYVEEKNGERRYFDDYKRSALAMYATDTSVSSKRQDLNTIRAMLEIAKARGWHSVEIRGSAEFKREAWIEATARGLEGRGFTPSDPDRQEAERRRAERGPSNEVRAHATVAHAPELAAPHAAKVKDAPVAAVPQLSQAPGKGEVAKATPREARARVPAPAPASSQAHVRLLPTAQRRQRHRRRPG